MVNLDMLQHLSGCPWVFPAVQTVRYSTNKTGHVRLMAAELKLNTGLDITGHGLRRTFITTARRLKIFEDADRLTNHVDSSISGRHYDATDVEDLRMPLQTIASELERLMKEGAAKVLLTLKRQRFRRTAAEAAASAWLGTLRP